MTSTSSEPITSRPTPASAPVIQDPAKDIALLDRIAAGDQQAVGQLYDRHCHLLYGLACRILSDRASSEPLVADVFLAVWMKDLVYDCRMCRTPAEWLVRVTRARAVQRLRRFAPALVQVERGEQDVSGTGRTAPYAVNSPSDRELVELAFFGGLTVAELADGFALSPSRVRASLMDGLHAIQLEPPTE